MNTKPIVRIASVSTPLEPQRMLPKAVYDYLLAGQPDSDLVLRIGTEHGKWFGDERYTEISEYDLIALIHGRPKPVEAADLGMTLPNNAEDNFLDTGHFSPELAKRLPKGHPFRKHHGIVDSEYDRIFWLIGDPDLSEEERQLIQETLLEQDRDNRAKMWNKLFGQNQLSQWAWFEIREQLLAALTPPYETYLDSLHPREAGVLRFLASGMDIPQVAHKFGVDEKQIKVIYCRAGEGFRLEFQETISHLQSYIEKFRIVDLVELAGVARDINPDETRDFLATRLLLKFCSGGVVTNKRGITYVLSNDLKDSIDKL